MQKCQSVTEEIWQWICQISPLPLTGKISHLCQENVLIEILPVSGNAENRHKCQFSNVTTDMALKNSFLKFNSFPTCWHKKLIAKVSKRDGGSLTAKMSNFTVTFDRKNISLMTKRTFILTTSVLIEICTCRKVSYEKDWQRMKMSI